MPLQLAAPGEFAERFLLTVQTSDVALDFLLGGEAVAAAPVVALERPPQLAEVADETTEHTSVARRCTR